MYSNYLHAFTTVCSYIRLSYWTVLNCTSMRMILHRQMSNIKSIRIRSVTDYRFTKTSILSFLTEPFVLGLQYHFEPLYSAMRNVQWDLPTGQMACTVTTVTRKPDSYQIPSIRFTIQITGWPYNLRNHRVERSIEYVGTCTLGVPQEYAHIVRKVALTCFLRSGLMSQIHFCGAEL